ncbi:hypothetical protein J6590_049014 [Homalodisca vitripennis]|nr:hypothetical protein J6590_049014 [Homalodisca vitripennis]
MPSGGGDTGRDITAARGTYPTLHCRWISTCNTDCRWISTCNTDCRWISTCNTDCRWISTCDTDCRWISTCDTDCRWISTCNTDCRRISTCNTDCRRISTCDTDCRWISTCNTDCRWISTCNTDCRWISTCSTDCRWISTCNTDCRWISTCNTDCRWISTCNTDCRWISTCNTDCRWISTCNTDYRWISTCNTDCRRISTCNTDCRWISTCNRLPLDNHTTCNTDCRWISTCNTDCRWISTCNTDCRWISTCNTDCRRISTCNTDCRWISTCNTDCLGQYNNYYFLQENILLLVENNQRHIKKIVDKDVLLSLEKNMTNRVRKRNLMMCLPNMTYYYTSLTIIVMTVSSFNDNPLVLIVSFDGFRYDYVNRNLTPTLVNLRKKSSHAPYMIPVFPSLTLPNHVSIATGLYPEVHGGLDNIVYDKNLKKVISYDYEIYHYNEHIVPLWHARGGLRLAMTVRKHAREHWVRQKEWESVLEGSEVGNGCEKARLRALSTLAITGFGNGCEKARLRALRWAMGVRMHAREHWVQHWMWESVLEGSEVGNGCESTFENTGFGNACERARSIALVAPVESFFKRLKYIGRDVGEPVASMPLALVDEE